MGVISWTAGQALWLLLAGQWELALWVLSVGQWGRHCGCYQLGSGTGTMGVISWTVVPALWVLLAGQRDKHCGCY